MVNDAEKGPPSFDLVRDILARGHISGPSPCLVCEGMGKAESCPSPIRNVAGNFTPVLPSRDVQCPNFRPVDEVQSRMVNLLVQGPIVRVGAGSQQI